MSHRYLAWNAGFSYPTFRCSNSSLILYKIPYPVLRSFSFVSDRAPFRIDLSRFIADCNMGIFYSFMGKGVPSSQMINQAMGALYKQFMQKDIHNFDDFHEAILDIFNNFNSALPGKHYDVPPQKEIQRCFTQWKEAKDEPERKQILVDFIIENVSLSKLDTPTLITGLVTPPAAMVAKRAGEKVPQLSVIKAIPDVVFIPSATIIALVSAKLCRKIYLKDGS